MTNEQLNPISQEALTLSGRELSLPPTLSEQEIQPISEENLVRFANIFTNNGQNKEYGEVLRYILENVRCLDQQRFEESLATLAEDIEQFVGEDDYYVLVEDGVGKTGNNVNSNKSSGFVADKIPYKRRPKKIITATELSNSDISSDIASGTKVVLVDDATYTGGNTSLLLSAIEYQTRKKIDPNRTLLCYTALTRTAIRETTRHYGLKNDNFRAVYQFPTLSELPELKKLIDEAWETEGETTPKMEEMLTALERGKDHVLCFFWHKVPDNFVPLFRKKIEDKSYLVDDTPAGIYPTYKKNQNISAGE